MMKEIIITGASSDVSISLIKKMNEAEEYKGAKIYCQYFSNHVLLENLRETLQNIELELFQCDLSCEDELNKWVSDLEKKEIQPSYIIHLAADKFDYMRLKDIEWNRFQKTLDIQLKSFVILTKKFVPQMKKRKFGKVLIMLSSYTLGIPPKFMSHYITVKYALLGFMKAIASEYIGSGISINAISPNMMETKFIENLDPRTIEMNAKASAMKRNIDVEEVSDAIMYLLSPKADYINGINLNMSGGDYM